MSGGPLKPKFSHSRESRVFARWPVPCYGKRRRSADHPASNARPACNRLSLRRHLRQHWHELPATPPQVSFQGGQLTISAQNSTLGRHLESGSDSDGATIDLPGNAPERVVGHFGPGPARDVLASLLNGSHFNYVLLGSPTDPDALDRVILMAKSGGAADSNPQPPSAAGERLQPGCL